MTTPVLLKDITDKSDMWSITVRVLRKWNLHQKTPPHEVFCVNMLLIDEEGTKIQASVLGKSDLDQFRIDDISEGKTYVFKTFSVSPNLISYRASTHPFKISFSPHTYFAEVDADCPRDSFSFMPIQEIRDLPDDQNIDYLIDVIGFVKTIGKMDAFNSQNGKKDFLRLILCDTVENEIECVLFDQTALDTYLAAMQNPDDEAVVAIINLARVGWTQDKHRQICSSYGATRVYFNKDIEEVRSMLESVKDRPSTLTMEFSQSLGTQRSRVSGGEGLLSLPKVDIADLPKQEQGKDFVLTCEIVKFESKYGWHYDACFKCKSIPKPVDPKVPKSPLICPTCKKAPSKIVPRLKVTYAVKDDTGTHSITFWDEVAVQLLGKNLQQMKLELQQANSQLGAWPEDLQKQAGKKLLIKVKLNDYNIRFPSSNISASEFALCEDLLQEFNSAASQDTQATFQSPELSQQINESSVPDTITHTVNLSEEDTTPPHIETIRSTSNSKGKRRITVPAKYQKANASIAASGAKDERLLKTVKQEK